MFPSSSPRLSGSEGPSAIVASVPGPLLSASFPSSVEQGAALMKSMQMYYDHTHGYPPSGGPPPAGLYPAILPSTYVLRIDDPAFYVLDSGLVFPSSLPFPDPDPVFCLLDGGFSLGPSVLRSSVCPCPAVDPVFHLLDGGFALGPMVPPCVADSASLWHDPVGLVDLPDGAFPSLDDLVTPLISSAAPAAMWCDPFSSSADLWRDPVGLLDLPVGSFPSLDDEVVSTVDIWCDPGGLSEGAFPSLDDSVQPIASPPFWDSGALDADLTLSHELP